MTNILSAISGQFSKSLVLGTFFPVLVFVTLGLVFVLPLLPPSWPLLKPLEILDTQWKVVIVTLTTLVISGIIYNLNIPIMRLYEAYPWQKWWIGRWRSCHYRAQYCALNARWHGMRTLLRALGPTDKRYQKIRRKWEEIAQTVNAKFPKDEALILPTRLGNTIRSFEDYSYRQYGMEAITLWPRLIAKIEKDYATAVDDAKTSFDFMMNSSVASLLLAMAILISGLLYAMPLSSPASLLLWLLQVATLTAVAYGFYLLSIGRAEAWGATVKSAFDLYRWSLLKQLGYARVPTTLVEERDLWNDIYQQMLYGDTPTIPAADYASKPTFAISAGTPADPDAIRLVTTRGVAPPTCDGTVKVTLWVKNTDLRKRPAADVVVTDALPEGFEYLWGSAKRADDSSTVDVEGANPYRFSIGSLNFCEDVVLTYAAIPRSEKK